MSVRVEGLLKISGLRVVGNDQMRYRRPQKAVDAVSNNDVGFAARGFDVNNRREIGACAACDKAAGFNEGLGMSESFKFSLMFFKRSAKLFEVKVAFLELIVRQADAAAEV